MTTLGIKCFYNPDLDIIQSEDNKLYYIEGRFLPLEDLRNLIIETWKEGATKEAGLQWINHTEGETRYPVALDKFLKSKGL